MPTILIVEDNANQRLLYEEELREQGYDVILAASGREALELVRNAPPDLVILDIHMPHMDGIETLGRLLSQDNRLPVILHTAYATYKSNFMTWSADAYVIKSTDRTELLDVIRDVLGRRTQEQDT